MIRSFKPVLFLKHTGHVLSAELRGLRLHGPRAWLALETVSSVLLAVSLANYLQMNDRWWVAISAYVVMRADWHTSLNRAAQRMAGTIGGASTAAILAPWVAPAMLSYALALATIAGIGIYRALGSRRSYGWLLATITGLLVLSDALADKHVIWLAAQRVADVAVGTFSCLTIASLVHLFRRAFTHSTAAPAPASQAIPSPIVDRYARTIRRQRALHALQGAFTIAVLACLDFHRHFHDFSQILVTVAVVLIIPLPSLLRLQSHENIVAMRMANRLLGCLLAAICAFMLLPLVNGQPLIFLLCLSVGVWLASHVQSGHDATSYLGTQFGIAFLMVFVQDHSWFANLNAAMLRLLGILAGVLSLGLVILLCSWLRHVLAPRIRC